RGCRREGGRNPAHGAGGAVGNAVDDRQRPRRRSAEVVEREGVAGRRAGIGGGRARLRDGDQGQVLDGRDRGGGHADRAAQAGAGRGGGGVQLRTLEQLEPGQVDAVRLGGSLAGRDRHLVCRRVGQGRAHVDGAQRDAQRRPGGRGHGDRHPRRGGRGGGGLEEVSEQRR